MSNEELIEEKEHLWDLSKTAGKDYPPDLIDDLETEAPPLSIEKLIQERS